MHPNVDTLLKELRTHLPGIAWKPCDMPDWDEFRESTDYFPTDRASICTDSFVSGRGDEIWYFWFSKSGNVLYMSASCSSARVCESAAYAAARLAAHYRARIKGLTALLPQGDAPAACATADAATQETVTK